MTSPLPEFVPVVWQNGQAGGTDIDKADLQRYETVIPAILTELADLRARLDALGGVSAARVVPRFGPTSERGPSVAAELYVDATLGGQLVVGLTDGSGGWQDALGVDLTTSGSNPGPTLTGVVNGDGTTSLSWTAKTGGATPWKYTVKERYASPAGVSGLVLVTATSSTRPASSAATIREYYVTATDALGVETAESNHVVLYYNGYTPTPGTGGGSTGGGTATSPAGIIQYGGQGGFWNLGVGYRAVDGGTHTDISYSDLKNGWSRQGYYYLSDDQLWAIFQSYAEGGKTSANTSYCRSELRELKSDGTSKASWDAGSGRHELSYRMKLLTWPTTSSGGAGSKREVVVGQIHDGSDDTLQIRIEGGNVVASVKGTEVTPLLATGYTLGTELAIGIVVQSGKLTVTVNGVTKINAVTFTGAGQYFKLGMYVQFSTASDKGGYPASASSSVAIRDVLCSHS